MRLKLLIIPCIILVLSLSACAAKKVEQSSKTSNQISASSAVETPDTKSDSTMEENTEKDTTSSAVTTSASINTEKNNTDSKRPPDINKPTQPEKSSTPKPAGTTSNTAPPAPAKSNQPKNFSRPDLMGDVVSISDSTVTLKLIEMPQFNGVTAPNHTQGSSQESSKQPPHHYSQALGNRPQTKYTGETKALTITAGVPITQNIRGQNGMEIKNITLKDIKAGDTLEIWYSDKSKGTISKISLHTYNRN